MELDNNATVATNGEQAGAAPTTAGTGAEASVNNTPAQQQSTTASTVANNATVQQAQPQQQSVAYDFSGVQLPEDFTLDADESAKFIDVIKDMGLSNEQAGNIVRFGTEYGERLIQGVIDEHSEMIKTWGDESRQALGADFDKTVGYCATALKVLEKDNPGIRAALDETGAGNRIEIIRAFAKLGELLSGDPGMAAGAGMARNVDPVNDFAKLYPNTDFSRYK